MRKLICMAIFLTAVLTANTVWAADETNWFFGAGYLKSDADTGITALTGTASLDETDNGFKLFGGYQLNPYVGFELSYADLGTATLKGNTGDTFRLNNTTYIFNTNNVTLDADSWAIGLGGVFSLPLDKVTGQGFLKYVTPFAKVGAYYWDQEFTGTGSGLSTSTVSDDGFDFYFGGGLSINLHKNFAITGEWQRYDGDGNIDTYSASLVFKF